MPINTFLYNSNQIKAEKFANLSSHHWTLEGSQICDAEPPLLGHTLLPTITTTANPVLHLASFLNQL